MSKTQEVESSHVINRLQNIYYETWGIIYLTFLFIYNLLF